MIRWRKNRKSPPRKWWVLEGDWGGQIYCTIPTRQDLRVEVIRELLLFIDDNEWPENKKFGRGINFYLQEEDEGLTVDGGMGGGRCLPDQIWIHPSIRQDVQEMILLVAGKASFC